MPVVFSLPIILSTVLSPQWLPSITNLALISSYNTTGVMFDTSDDALASHAVNVKYVPPFVGVLTEPDSRAKYQAVHAQCFIPAIFYVLKLHSLTPITVAEKSNPTFPAPLQPSLCTFLI